jgi:hypothetical protein
MMPRFICALALVACAAAAFADDRADYERRVAARYAALFQELDRNQDGSVSREEAQGNLNFIPSFADIDIDRNDIVTRGELTRYITLRFGSDAASVASAPASTVEATR